MSELPDSAARIAAVDYRESVCVSAPAGSGKTELLIQRYLNLLSRVQRPEQILAITFTRKAAAEMRERVLESLHNAAQGLPSETPHQATTRALANQVLAADRHSGWDLLRTVSRFNIKTIDSFCAGLTRQMPVLSQFGAQARVNDDVTPLYIEAVQELFGLLESDHPVAVDLEALLRHFDNDWERLQALLVSMLARREQWHGYLGIHHAPAEAEAYLVAAVGAMVGNELREVARLLTPFKTELLELLRFAAANLDEPLPVGFPVSEHSELAVWRTLRDLLTTKKGEWRKKVTRKEGFPAGAGETAQRKKQWQTLLLQLQSVGGLLPRLASIQSLPETGVSSDSWRLVLHLSRLLPTLAAQLLLVFRQHGVVDHSQVAQSALLALGEEDSPTELALRLDYRIEHILVDEFQDTAITQYELLQKLTRGWGEYNEQNPRAPRTFMIVGDGMQSIYGFRGANVGLFLKARNEGFNGVLPRYLELRCNFRSDSGVVDWINDAFGKAFPETNDVYRSRVRYSPATAVRPRGTGCAVAMRAFTGDDARQREVQYIGEQVADCVRNSDQSIAILGRSRSHLQPVVQQLKQQGIPCNAPDLDSLSRSPAVADLLTLCRALASDADRLAWMALLRAPWCGLKLADLLCLAELGEAPPYTSIWSILQQPASLRALSDDGRERLRATLPALHKARKMRDRLNLRVWVEQAWIELGGAQCASGAESLLDVENFLQLLEQAETEGIGFDPDWLAQRVEKRYMNARHPDSKVHLLTLHKAKGLEFDRVIIPQLDRAPRRDERPILLWDEYSNDEGKRAFLVAADDHSAAGAPTLYSYLLLLRREKMLLEATRLLYVGATRAVHHLLLTAAVRTDEATGLPQQPAKLSLLEPLWPTFSQGMQLCSQPVGKAPATAARRARPLVRLVRENITTPSPSPEPQSLAVAVNAPLYPVDTVDRSIGNVVHKALDELSRRPRLPSAASDADRRRWRTALQCEGLRGEALESALDVVMNAVAQSLQADGEGRWVLSSQHSEARSEWALTTVEARSQTRDIVIDRSFIDTESGVRWVIDYKSGRPLPGESIADYVHREGAAYREQLRVYRDAVRFLGSQPLRCALFFTALGQLHVIRELDLPALDSGEGEDV